MVYKIIRYFSNIRYFCYCCRPQSSGLPRFIIRACKQRIYAVKVKVMSFYIYRHQISKSIFTEIKFVLEWTSVTIVWKVIFYYSTSRSSCTILHYNLLWRFVSGQIVYHTVFLMKSWICLCERTRKVELQICLADSQIYI